VQGSSAGRASPGKRVAVVTPEETVGVEVPASCANLGSGFDSLAVAVGRSLVAVTADREARRVIITGEGADELPSDERNRVWQAFVAYCERSGEPVPDVSLRVRSTIPLERGLGSSAAAAVAGVTLARAATGGGGSDRDLVDLAAAFDGHADNVAAALLGGLVVVVDGQPRRLEPTDAWMPVLCVPQARQSTNAARELLPEQVSLADAAATAGRAALLVAGLTGATALDVAACTDVLHEPPRLAAMPESGRLVAALRDSGRPACLSGAGPTVLALVPGGDQEAVQAVRALAGQGWEVDASRWNRGGAEACPPTAALGQAWQP